MIDKLDGTYVAGGEALEGCERFWGGHCDYIVDLRWSNCSVVQYVDVSVK
jgi:hypothetical protein